MVMVNFSLKRFILVSRGDGCVWVEFDQAFEEQDSVMFGQGDEWGEWKVFEVWVISECVYEGGIWFTIVLFDQAFQWGFIQLDE